VVSYAGTSVDVTGGTQVDLTGLADGQKVTVTVVAVNEAGNGAQAGPVTAAAIANPTVTLGARSVGFNSITVSFSVNDGGGTATCNLAISGAGNANGSCTGITVGGLAPGQAYNYTVTVTNQAGSAKATGSASTKALMGVVHCVGTPTSTVNCDAGNGVGIYSKPWQDTSSETNWNGHNGVGYQAYCKAQGMDGNQQASATLHAAYFNNNKVSDQWIRITPIGSSTNRYIPWVWFNMNPDDLNLLPGC
jgi:hypothetical protein